MNVMNTHRYACISMDAHDSLEIYTHINVLKITMVAVSVIEGVSVSIIDEKRLGKPPLPSGGPHHPTTL